MAFRLNAKLFSPTEALFDAARATSKGIEAKGTVEVEGLLEANLKLLAYSIVSAGYDSKITANRGARRLDLCERSFDARQIPQQFSVLAANSLVLFRTTESTRVRPRMNTSVNPRKVYLFVSQLALLTASEDPRTLAFSVIPPFAEEKCRLSGSFPERRSSKSGDTRHIRISPLHPSDGWKCCENKDARAAREGTCTLVSRSFQTVASVVASHPFLSTPFPRIVVTESSSNYSAMLLAIKRVRAISELEIATWTLEVEPYDLATAF
uniref:Uncharacterized protein n=1 Tax=Vespula pensylvanica TaxID=30213 RepID=A0A834NSR0_VESPE|nr:hypothetical protein H0235_011570 [Vespula pensylvanica]